MSITRTNIQWTHLPGREGYSANPIRFRDRETGEAVTWACVKSNPSVLLGGDSE